MSGTTHPITKQYITEDLNPQVTDFWEDHPTTTIPMWC